MGAVGRLPGRLFFCHERLVGFVDRGASCEIGEVADRCADETTDGRANGGQGSALEVGAKESAFTIRASGKADYSSSSCTNPKADQSRAASMSELDGGNTGAWVCNGRCLAAFCAGDGISICACEDAGGVRLAIDVKKCACGKRLDASPVGACVRSGWRRRLLGECAWKYEEKQGAYQ
jgi:hypothetical protein